MDTLLRNPRGALGTDPTGPAVTAWLTDAAKRGRWWFRTGLWLALLAAAVLSAPDWAGDVLAAGLLMPYGSSTDASRAAARADEQAGPAPVTTVFQQIRDAHGRVTLHAPALGAQLPAAVHSTVLVHTVGADGARGLGTGVVVWTGEPDAAGGRTVDVLTALHVVRDHAVHVELGQHGWPATVVPGPGPERMAEVLRGTDTRAELVRALAAVDLALVRVRLTAPLSAVALGHEPVPGHPVTMVGWSGAPVPIDGMTWDNSASSAQRLIVAGGFTAPERWAATPVAADWPSWYSIVAGDRWMEQGASGGPIIARGTLVGLITAAAWTLLDERGTAVKAVIAAPAAVIRAFLAASWLEHPPPGFHPSELPLASGARPYRGADSPSLLVWAGRLLGYARTVLDEAERAVGSSRNLVPLVEQVRAAAEGVAHWTMRDPEPLEPELTDIEQRIESLVDRTWQTLAESARAVADGYAALADLTRPLGQASPWMPSEPVFGRAEDRRRTEQLLTVLTQLAPLLTGHPLPGESIPGRRVRATLVDLGDRAVGQLIARARAGEVPPDFLAGVRHTAAGWRWRQTQRHLDEWRTDGAPPGRAPGLIGLLESAREDVHTLGGHTAEITSQLELLVDRLWAELPALARGVAEGRSSLLRLAPLLAEAMRWLPELDFDRADDRRRTDQLYTALAALTPLLTGEPPTHESSHDREFRETFIVFADTAFTRLAEAARSGRVPPDFMAAGPERAAADWFRARHQRPNATPPLAPDRGTNLGRDPPAPGAFALVGALLLVGWLVTRDPGVIAAAGFLPWWLNPKLRRDHRDTLTARWRAQQQRLAGRRTQPSGTAVPGSAIGLMVSASASLRVAADLVDAIRQRPDDHDREHNLDVAWGALDLSAEATEAMAGTFTRLAQLTAGELGASAHLPGALRAVRAQHDGPSTAGGSLNQVVDDLSRVLGWLPTIADRLTTAAGKATAAAGNLMPIHRDQAEDLKAEAGNARLIAGRELPEIHYQIADYLHTLLGEADARGRAPLELEERIIRRLADPGQIRATSWATLAELTASLRLPDGGRIRQAVENSDRLGMSRRGVVVLVGERVLANVHQGHGETNTGIVRLDQPGRRILLDRGLIVIGSHPGTDLQLPGLEPVHALLFFRVDRGWFVGPHSGRASVVVGERRVGGFTRLAHGQPVTLNAHALELHNPWRLPGRTIITGALLIAALWALTGTDAGVPLALAAALPPDPAAPRRYPAAPRHRYPVELDPAALHRGYPAELNWTARLRAVRASGRGITDAEAEAVRLAAAASRPVRKFARVSVARWAGLSPAELPADFTGVLALDGFTERITAEAMGEKVANLGNLVAARLGGTLLIDTDVWPLFARATPEQRRSWLWFALAGSAGRAPPLPGLDELAASRAAAGAIARALLGNRHGAARVEDLAWELRALPGTAQIRWLGRRDGSVWAFDPDLAAAGFIPTMQRGRLALRLDAGDRDSLWLDGWASSRYGGRLATLAHRLRGINTGWAAPAGWPGPAHGEVVFGALAHAWRQGRLGPHRHVARDLYLRHADLDGEWARVFPDGVEFVARLDVLGRPWLHNFYPGPALNSGTGLSDARNPVVRVTVQVGPSAFGKATGVRMGRYTVATALHVVEGERPYRDLRVGRDALGFLPASGYVRVQPHELPESARAALTALHGNAVDFALVVVPELTTLDGAVSIARPAEGDLAEGTPLLVAGYPQEKLQLNIGPWHGDQALVPSSPGYSGGPLFVGDRVASLHARTEPAGGAVPLGPPPVLAELVRIATSKAADQGLLPDVELARGWLAAAPRALPRNKYFRDIPALRDPRALVDTGARLPAELATLELVASIVAFEPLEEPPTADFWRAVFEALPRLAEAGSSPLYEVYTRLFGLLTEAVDRPFAPGGDWDFIRDSDWLDGYRTGTSRRDQLTMALLIAATGRAEWVRDIPRRQSSRGNLTELLRLLTAPELDSARPEMLAILHRLPDRRWSGDRAQFLTAWLWLAQNLVRMSPAVTALDLQPAVREALRRLDQRLRTEQRTVLATAIRAALTDLQRLVIARAGDLHGARLDQPVDIEPGSDLWNALVGYLGETGARPELSRLLARYLEVFAITGSREAASAAFHAAWVDWLTPRARRAPPVIARDQAPADEIAIVGGREVIIGVARDPVGILHLGHPNLGGHCFDCVRGRQRQDAQDYVLHPRIAVVFAWERLPGGGRGRRLAVISVFVTDQGIVWFSHPYTSSAIDFAPALRAYLDRWAAATNQPLLTPVARAATYRPAETAIPAGGTARTTTLTFPADGAVERVWADPFHGHIDLPAAFEVQVHESAGRRPERLAAAPLALVGLVPDGLPPLVTAAVAVVAGIVGAYLVRSRFHGDSPDLATELRALLLWRDTAVRQRRVERAEFDAIVETPGALAGELARLRAERDVALRSLFERDGVFGTGTEWQQAVAEAFVGHWIASGLAATVRQQQVNRQVEAAESVIAAIERSEAIDLVLDERLAALHDSLTEYVELLQDRPMPAEEWRNTVRDLDAAIADVRAHRPAPPALLAELDRFTAARRDEEPPDAESPAPRRARYRLELALADFAAAYFPWWDDTPARLHRMPEEWAARERVADLTALLVPGTDVAARLSQVDDALRMATAAYTEVFRADPEWLAEASLRMLRLHRQRDTYAEARLALSAEAGRPAEAVLLDLIRSTERELTRASRYRLWRWLAKHLGRGPPPPVSP